MLGFIWTKFIYIKRWIISWCSGKSEINHNLHTFYNFIQQFCYFATHKSWKKYGS